MKRYMLWTMFVLATAATGVWAAERLMVPQETLLPLYVSGLGHTGMGPDDLIGTSFYYPPEDIPASPTSVAGCGRPPQPSSNKWA